MLGSYDHIAKHSLLKLCVVVYMSNTLFTLFIEILGFLIFGSNFWKMLKVTATGIWCYERTWSKLWHAMCIFSSQTICVRKVDNSSGNTTTKAVDVSMICHDLSCVLQHWLQFENNDKNHDVLQVVACRCTIRKVFSSVLTRHSWAHSHTTIIKRLSVDNNGWDVVLTLMSPTYVVAIISGTWMNNTPRTAVTPY